MATTTYGIISESGEMLFNGYQTAEEAREFCQNLNAAANCRVVEVKTTVEYTEI